MTRRPAAIAALLCLCCPAVLSGQVTPAAPRRPFVAVRGVLGAGVTHFISDKTFKAVFGDARGVTWLGAGQLLFRGGMFAEVSVERFRRTGQRVFVFEGNVIPLGIADTVTITPITVAGGYRFVRSGSRVTPYAGAGIGSYALREESDFAEDSDNVDTRHAGYLLFAGAEVRLWRWLGVAGELRFATVPDGIGQHGVASEYGETNLGGTTAGVKLIVGR